MVKPYPHERRKYYRLQLPQPLICKVSIANVDECFVRTGTATVLIENIEPGGLKFLSNLRFPVNDTLVLYFQTRLLGEKVKLHGSIVRMMTSANGYFEYGVRFFIDSETRDSLSQLLNKLVAKMRYNNSIPKSDFFPEGVLSFINQQ